MRLTANKEVAQYVVPKLKAMEVTGADGQPLIPDAIKIIYE